MTWRMRGRPTDFPLLAMIPLLCHELSVPAKDRVGCHDRGQFLQCLAAQRLAFDGQQTALVIGEQDAFLALGLHQGNDLIVLELDHFLLPVVNPAGEDGQEELPRLQNEAHGCSGC